MVLSRGLHASSSSVAGLNRSTATRDNGSVSLPPDAATASGLQEIQDALGTPAQVPSSVTLTHSTVTVTTSSATALAANSLATYRLFQNIDATNTITIAFGVTAVNNTQIVIQPKSQVAFNIEMGNLDRRIVKCICGAGSPVLCMTEGV